MRKAKVTVHPDFKIGEIDRRLFSGYLEPIGNWVYGGIWNPKHPTADELGFRGDMIEAVRELGMPAIRLPGGNIVSGWDWRESIGPIENRKARLDLAWRQYEPNVVGHDEYLEWTRRVNAEPLYTLNLGTGDIASAMECVEYTSHPGGTYWSDLRKENGYPEPHGVKTWYLGNEPDGPWEIASYQKDPDAYGVKAHEISKAVKWIDPTVKTVAGGTSSPLNRTYPEWDVRVLEKCYETVDYLSIHYYHNAPADDLAAYLNASSAFEDYIHTILASCDYVKTKLRHPYQMMLSFDEYGVSFNRGWKTTPGRPGYIPHDTYVEFSEANLNREFRQNDPENMRERMRRGSEMITALGLSSVMLTLLRHADRIKIGCMTAAIGAAIGYDHDHVWKNAAYHPLKHLLTYANGSSCMPIVDGPTFDVKGYNLNEFVQVPEYEGVQAIEAACAYSEDGEGAIFLINRSDEEIEIELDARGFGSGKGAEHIELFCSDLEKRSSVEQGIEPSAAIPLKAENGKLSLVAKPYSWNVVRVI